MIKTRKLLTALISAAALTFCFGTTVFASEIVQAPLSSESSAEGTGSEDNMTADSNSGSTPVQELQSTEQEQVQDEDQTQALGDGYYVDEQGQVYYDASSITIEEPVIEDLPEEDTEDVQEDKETSDTSSEVKTDNSKDQKETKETEIKKPSYSEADLRLLSCLIYAEAGNQSYQGMLAVANVVINRAKSDVYWHVNTIKEVIYDHKWSVQFSVTIKNSKTGLSALDKALKYYDSGKFPGPNPEAQKKAMNRAIKAAKDALQGKNNIGNYLCFTSKYGSSSIKKKYPDYKIIGDHIFYRTK